MGPTSDSVAGTPIVVPGQDANDLRLKALWTERSSGAEDFPIGPGDLLEISVPGINELQGREARVGADGHIYLPLAGDLAVAGKSEKEVRQELNRRMDKYLYHPQTNLFVKSYNSRLVSAMGAVERPGMYVINGSNDTVRTLIERAGGPTDDAAREVVLIPVPPGQPSYTLNSQAAAASAAAAGTDEPVSFASADGPVGGKIDPDIQVLSGSHVPTKNAASAVINLAPGSAENRYLDLPLKPGDAIYVPAAGKVTVVGWVSQPLTVSVTSGLTVLGAVAAAGGPLYAGNIKAVKVIRQGNSGRSETVVVDLEKVQKHQAPNVLVEANDIVDVPYATSRLPGYALYYAAKGIVSFAPAALVASPP